MCFVYMLPSSAGLDIRGLFLPGERRERGGGVKGPDYSQKGEWNSKLNG